MLEWIVSASLLIILVILLRKLPIAPWQRYALWLVVLVRLLIPVQLFSLPVTALPLPDVESAMEEVDLLRHPYRQGGRDPPRGCRRHTGEFPAR